MGSGTLTGAKPDSSLFPFGVNVALRWALDEQLLCPSGGAGAHDTRSLYDASPGWSSLGDAWDPVILPGPRSCRPVARGWLWFTRKGEKALAPKRPDQIRPQISRTKKWCFSDANFILGSAEHCPNQATIPKVWGGEGIFPQASPDAVKFGPWCHMHDTGVDARGCTAGGMVLELP